jgi:2-C-methyl-D-erythritol 4-phosphate cytidylyltransferase
LEAGARPHADFTAVVVAAGRAARFGGPLPKQFQPLAGRSVLRRSVEAMARHPAVRGVVVVLAPEEAGGERGREVTAWPAVERVVAGGATRSESVRRGLAAAEGTPFVLVHDAARPLVTDRLVGEVVEATRRTGAAIPLLPVPDTVKSVAGDRVTGTLPREGLGLAQTPQGARRDWLQEALAREGEAAPTDEAAALERAGHAVTVVAARWNRLRRAQGRPRAAALVGRHPL